MSEAPAIIAPAPAGPLAPRERPPTFSILIAAYQAADTIAVSVRSALAQTYRAHEVIVVDDGSTDDPGAALGDLAGQVTLISQENGGGACALNTAWQAASGDFVAILDADDAYHPRRLEALAALAVQRPDLDLITTDARFIVDGAHVGRFYEHNRFAADGQRTAIFDSCFVGGWPAVRRDALRSAGGFDQALRTGYDWDCWLRLIVAGARAGLVTDALYDYRLHGASVTAKRVASLWDRVRVLEKAQSDPHIRPDERPALSGALRARRTHAVLVETGAALAARAAHPRPGAGVPPGSRRRLASLAATPGITRRARVAALMGAALPSVATRLVGADRPPDQRFVPGA